MEFIKYSDATTASVNAAFLLAKHFKMLLICALQPNRIQITNRELHTVAMRIPQQQMAINLEKNAHETRLNSTKMYKRKTDLNCELIHYYLHTINVDISGSFCKHSFA